MARLRPLSLERAVLALQVAGTLWILANCSYVYLVLGGARTYRVESAAILFAALLLPTALSAAGRSPACAAPPPERAHDVVLATAAVATFLWVYIPLLRFPFLSDDYVFLRLYEDARNIPRTPEFFRPAFAALFWLIRRFGAPPAFHIASLSLHLASAALVYHLARRLLGSRPGALLAFTTFLLNPTQLEAVLWVSGLQDLLWTFFILAALLRYVHTQELSARRLGETLVLCGLALLAKETAVCYMLLLPAADWMLFRFDRGRYRNLMYVLAAAELGAYLIVRSHVVEGGAFHVVWPSAFFLKQLLGTPYRVFIHPWNQMAVTAGPRLFFGSSMVAVLLIFYSVVIRERSAGVVAGAYLMLASTLPVYALFYIGPQLAGARYVYFAAAGWALLLSDALMAAVRGRRAATMVSAVLMLVLALTLKANLRPWHAAGAAIDEAENALRRGESPEEALREWSADHPVGLIIRDGLPVEYQGVNIFRNGYPEFEQLVASSSGSDGRSGSSAR